MLHEDVKKFYRAISAPCRLLGLDVGDRTVGLAVSDYLMKIATADSIIRRKKFTIDADKIFQMYDARECGGMVVGLPLNLVGTDSRQTQSVRQFARNMLKLRECEILLYDERMSTKIADDALREAGLTYRRKHRYIDKVAASVILQNALDEMGGL